MMVWVRSNGTPRSAITFSIVGMALHDAITKGKLRSAGLVVLVGSGVGYNQAAVAFRMPE